MFICLKQDNCFVLLIELHHSMYIAALCNVSFFISPLWYCVWLVILLDKMDSVGARSIGVFLAFTNASWYALCVAGIPWIHNTTQMGK